MTALAAGSDQPTAAAPAQTTARRRTLRPVYQATGLVLLGLGVYVVLAARGLNYYTRLGPGPGFFPLWLGVAIGLLSLVWLAQVTLRPAEPLPADFVPDRPGTLRILAILLALVAFMALLETVGFRLSMLAFLLFLLTALGRQHPLLTLAVALAGSFGVHYAFQTWLGVYLPPASLEFLHAWGF